LVVVLVTGAVLAVGSWLALRRPPSQPDAAKPDRPPSRADLPNGRKPSPRHDAPRRGKPPPCEGVTVTPEDDIEEAIKNRRAGTTFCLAAGTYVIDDNIEPRDGIELVGSGMGVTVLRSEGANIVIDAEGTRDLAISHLDISGAHGSVACKPQCGSGLAGGRRVTIDSVAFYGNENHGIGGVENLTVRNSVFHHNGSPGFMGCCAGGLKSGSGFRIERSKVYENTGVGIWCDEGCTGGMEVYDNEVRDNTLDGIRYEISDGGAQIVGNFVTNNNKSDTPGGHGGIVIVASDNAEVRGNTLASNKGGGIVVTHTPRGDSDEVVIEGNLLRGDHIRGCSQKVACIDNR